MRQKIVAGNWKMNNTISEGLELTKEIVNLVKNNHVQDVNIVLAAPFIHLSQVKELIDSSANIHLSAQNCSEHKSGAYTGEISAQMLASIGAEYVVLGHSERREYFGETNAQLAQKTDIVLENNLLPIFCCGESLDVRESGEYVSFVTSQIEESLFHLSAEAFSKVVIAYEPIWAIGTGKTASSDQAQEMHEALRKFVAGKYGDAIAEDLSILYGGSCKPSNAPELFACKDVDGGLIGGASLKAEDFIGIIKSY